MKKQIIISALAGLALAACTNDDNFADFTGPVELNFSGEVSTVQTRATAEAWTSVHNTIGVTATQSSAGTSYQNKKYSTTDITDGSAPTEVAFKAAEADKFYFGSAKETATFAAYSPYVADEKVSSNLVTVSADDNYNVTDYLFATTSSLNYSTASSAKLTFQHKMAQIKVVVKLSDEVSNPVSTSDNMGSYITTYGTTLTQVELSNLITDGTFNITTGETALTSGATAKTITKSIDGSSTIEAEMGEYIILPTDKKNLVVTLTTTDVSTSATTTYQATLDDELKAGNSYTFTVTAKKSGLSVEGVIQPWTVVTDGSLTAGMITPPIGEIADASESWMYDLVFSDGSFMHTTDADGSSFISDLGLTDEQKASACGIVFYTDIDMTQKDKILAGDYPACTHGLIVALDDVYSSINFKWMETAISVYDTFQSKTEPYKDYPSITGQTSSDYLGYSNTIIWLAYNAQDGASNPAIPVSYLKTFREENSKIDGCTDWFIPGYGEASLLFASFVYNEYVINDCLTNLKNQGINATKIYGYNWTSSEQGSSKMTYFSYGNVYSLSKTETGQLVRPICAF